MEGKKKEKRQKKGLIFAALSDIRINGHAVARAAGQGKRTTKANQDRTVALLAGEQQLAKWSRT
jgi:hypothetical protein